MQARVALTFTALLALFVSYGCIPQVVDGIPPFGSGPPHWETRASLPTPRGAAAAAVVNGKIYIIGGGNGATPYGIVEEYDLATDTWTNCGGGCLPIPGAATSIEVSVAAINGILYVFGGYDATTTLQTTVWAFDPATNTWPNCGGTCDAIPIAAQGAQASAVTAGSIVYLVGGSGGGADLNTFDPSQSPGAQWTSCGGSCAAVPGQRNRARSVVQGDTIYLLGGYDGGAVNTVLAYSLSGNTWVNPCGSSCPPMAIGGMDPYATAIGTTFYVVGPEPVSGPATDYLDSFDTTTQTWTNCGGSCPVKPTPVYWPAGVVVGNELHAIGGGGPSSAVGTHEVLVVP